MHGTLFSHHVLYVLMALIFFQSVSHPLQYVGKYDRNRVYEGVDLFPILGEDGSLIAHPELHSSSPFFLFQGFFIMSKKIKD